jgi:hypothetical protein
MTGIVVVAKGKSLDVRTVDFERIADALRSRAKNSEVAAKLLQSKDDFGMDMICADELSRTEFKAFLELLDDIRIELTEASGLVDFIDQVRLSVQADERLHG